MGTRSLTIFSENDGMEICVMYRQMDGYPEGHGKDLAELLSGMQLVDGLSINQPEKIANGMSCLAAQVVAHFKEGPGGIYLCPAGTRRCGEDYTYFVTGRDGDEVKIEVYDRKKVLFKGPASNFKSWLKPWLKQESQTSKREATCLH